MTAGERSPSPPADGLRRPRIDGLLADAADHRLVTIVGPAGSGKTTVLAHLAEAHPGATAWYNAHVGDWRSRDLLNRLGTAVRTELCGHDRPEGWTRVEEAARTLRHLGSGPTYLLIDDLHLLRDTPAMETLDDLLDRLPRQVTLVVASRAVPDLNLSRLRVSGLLLELDADDLRFRLWEAERLFRDVYGEPLLPDELAELTRSTQGWAVGLQLFHLAVSGKSRRDRRITLDALERGSQQLTRDYLTSNVLAELPADLREFLLGTCLPGALTPSLCDRLLDRDDSIDLLEELERRQVFTARVDDRPTYRYHEVLRRYLRGKLARRLGAPSLRRRHHEAGRLLEQEGLITEALHAYCRAEAWPEARRLVRGAGPELIDEAGEWINRLPPAFVSQDPWLLLVRARQHLAGGEWSEAVATYRQAEEALEDPEARDRCARERATVDSWLQPAPPPSTGWSSRLRLGVARNPLQVAANAPQPDSAAGCLARAALALLAGDVGATHRWLDAMRDHAPVEPALPAVGTVLEALASWLAGEPSPRGALLGAAGTLEQLGLSWPARLAHASLALKDRGAIAEVARLRSERARRGDDWGAALAGLLEGLARLGHGQPTDGVLQSTAEVFEGLGAGTLEAWARAAGALSGAIRGEGAPAREVDAAIGLARTTGTPGAVLLATLAAAADGAGHREVDEDSFVGDLAARLGIDLALLEGMLQRRDADEPVGAEPSRRTAELRCFGPFRLIADGRELDATALSPRLRHGLQLLALNTQAPLHRDQIGAALWPEADPDAAVRNIQVMISSLRAALSDRLGDEVGIHRRGEAYELRLPDGAFVDHRRFRQLRVEALDARMAGDATHERNRLRRALRCYTGRLLAGAGALDWLVEERRRYRWEATTSCTRLSQLLLDGGDLPAAITTCERGLQLDRYHDPLWRLLIDAHERAGDPAEAHRVRRRYAAALEDLGLDAEIVAEAAGGSSAR